MAEFLLFNKTKNSSKISLRNSFRRSLTLAVLSSGNYFSIIRSVSCLNIWLSSLTVDLKRFSSPFYLSMHVSFKKNDSIVKSLNSMPFCLLFDSRSCPFPWWNFSFELLLWSDPCNFSSYLAKRLLKMFGSKIGEVVA